MPSIMTQSSMVVEHTLMAAKKQRFDGTISSQEYKDEVVKDMRSKKGYVMSMNSITVEGYLKMVISPTVHCHESTVFMLLLLVPQNKHIQICCFI